MTVTVCIPAYRAGRFLAETLESVLGQTYPDVRVAVRIDPADSDGTGAPEDTLAALTPFLADRRVRVERNQIRCGWDSNTRALLAQVDTPYFAILPHDDVWDPRYVEILLNAVERQPSASVAYGDLFTFGVADPWRHAVQLPPTGDLRQQLLSFMLQGAEAMPWRGVTRSVLLPSVGGFPTDGHGGYAVECEYALSLILAGPAIHLPRTLYYKRIHPPTMMTASRARLMEPDRAELERAWRKHVDRMGDLLRQGLTQHSGGTPAAAMTERLIWPAYTAAMLRRYPVEERLPPEGAESAREALSSLSDMDAEVAGPVISKLHLVLWRHTTALGDTEQSRAHAEAAVAANPAAPDACLALAAHLEGRCCLLEALDMVAQSERAFPGVYGAMTLRRRIYDSLGWSPKEA